MSTVRDDFRNVVYKLCEGREVPLLVTDIIAGCLVHEDLFTISKVSRSLNEQANAIIYRDIVVNLDGSEHSIKNATLLFRTLLTNETAALAVRTLSLAGDPLQDWRKKFSTLRDDESIEESLRGKTLPAMYADLTPFTQGETELYDKLAISSSASRRPSTSQPPVWALLLQALRLTPQIQDFGVSSDYFRFPDFRSALQDLARDSSVGKLRSCSLCLDLLRGHHRHASVVQDWDSALLALFAVSEIQSITAVLSLKSEAVRQLRPGESSITRLDLHHYQIQDCDLASLLAAAPSLRYLKYHAITDHACLGVVELEGSLGLEPLYDALHHVSDSLQELHISQNFDEDSIQHDEDYSFGQDSLSCQRGQLSSLKRLHTLTIPYATLLGIPRKGHVWEWDTILPSSLRRIVLTDNIEENCRPDNWTDEELMPVISTMVEWLSATQRGHEAADFELHLTRLQYDFNASVRQELTRNCEGYGVRCSIKKEHRDLHEPPRVQIARGGGRGNLTRGRGRGRGA